MDDVSSGQVQVTTVLGPVPADELGMTLTHEHLICDWTAPLGEPRGAGGPSLFTRRVEPSIRWLLIEDPSCCRDNLRVDDAAAVADELQRFVEAGGQTVVDCTNADIGRDPGALREISRRTGLNIVMGSGWYVHRTTTVGPQGPRRTSSTPSSWPSSLTASARPASSRG